MEFRLPTTVPTTAVDKAQEITGSVYLDRKECAAYMGVSEKFLATHLHDGPRRLRVGSKVIYRLADVENWMHQQEVTR